MSNLAGAALMLVATIAAVIVIGGVMGFLRWLVSRVVTGIAWSLRTLLRAIGFGSRWLAWALQVAVAYAAAQVWRACAAGLRHLATMIGKGVFRLMTSIHDGWRGRDASRESERVDPLTSALLKQRYGELIRIVHPDKGFPNRVFAQQINAAVMTIKKAHGWR